MSPSCGATDNWMLSYLQVCLYFHPKGRNVNYSLLTCMSHCIENGIVENCSCHDGNALGILLDDYKEKPLLRIYEGERQRDAEKDELRQWGGYIFIIYTWVMYLLT